MGEFVTKLIAVCCGAALCDIFCSHKKGSSAKAVRVICSLCICSVMFSFFTGLTESGVLEELKKASEADFHATETKENELEFYTMTVDELERNTADILFKKFGIICQSVSIDFNIASSEGRSSLELVSVDILTQSGTDKAKISAAEIFLKDSFGCDMSIR